MKHIDPVELRGDVERDIVDVVDVVSANRQMSRMELVEKILGEWVEKVTHEASLVVRLSESKGKVTE